MMVPNTPETSMCRALATHPGPNVSWVATPSCSPDLIYGWILEGPHSHRGFSLKVPIRERIIYRDTHTCLVHSPFSQNLLQYLSKYLCRVLCYNLELTPPFSIPAMYE